MKKINGLVMVKILCFLLLSLIVFSVLSILSDDENPLAFESRTLRYALTIDSDIKALPVFEPIQAPLYTCNKGSVKVRYQSAFSLANIQLKLNSLGFLCDMHDQGLRLRCDKQGENMAIRFNVKYLREGNLINITGTKNE